MKTARVSTRKQRGAHFTPPELARFLAARLIGHLGTGHPETLRVLDPACGDGELLAALAQQAEGIRHRLELVGVETDGATCQEARLRLAACQVDSVDVLHGDFLESAAARREPPGLWTRAEVPLLLQEPFDVVIANPPYVRTQVVGAKKAQELAASFGLTGRVDLYHPFLIAATESLAAGGVIGVITSNRFLCTQAGAAVRGYLSGQYDALEIIDLGDTKLFEAAVLPAIFIGRRLAGARPSRVPLTRFVRVYSSDQADESVCHERRESVFELLDAETNGTFRVPTGVFDVSVGQCRVPPSGKQPWNMLTDRDSGWMQGIKQKAVGVIQDFAAVRVGVKTTADRVFIRSDWESLPANLHPEPELLHPLRTHEDARRWFADSTQPPRYTVLYPHEVVSGQRQPVDLRRFPRAKRYLESHRHELEAREYVIQAGRRWYEIWVPQDPNVWSTPRIVCPDISPEPRFYLDKSGWIVNGDSYWITLRPGQPADLLYLILAVANSRVMAAYHDLAFNNRLYSGRRRYLTQHVAQYPLPDPASSAGSELVRLVRTFVGEQCADPKKQSRFEETVNRLVAAAFDAQPLELRNR